MGQGKLLGSDGLNVILGSCTSSTMGTALDYCEPPFNRTALWEASWKKNNEEVVKLLAGYGASVDYKDYQGRTPLHEAAYHGQMNTVLVLLAQGHSLDCRDIFGQTPLFRATA